MVEEVGMREDENSSLRLLTDHLREWSDRTGILSEVWALPKSEIPDEVAGKVFAVVREALALVEQGSRARRVSIALTVAESGLRLTVSYDGTGLIPETARARIVRMKAAFAEIGGTLLVNGVPGEGATISGFVPRTSISKARITKIAARARTRK